MTREDTFETLARQAKSTLETTQQELGTRHRARAAAQTQLDTLQRYRGEYQEALHAGLRAGVGAQQCRIYERFIAALDSVIAREYETIAGLDRAVHDSQIRYQAARRRSTGLETLVSREREGRSLRERRLEQKHSDEFAARMTYRRQHP